jgi:formate dehydrogenase
MADEPLDFGTLEKIWLLRRLPRRCDPVEKDDMKARGAELMKFFEDESCGQCTPCRVGARRPPS